MLTRKTIIMVVGMYCVLQPTIAALLHWVRIRFSRFQLWSIFRWVVKLATFNKRYNYPRPNHPHARGEVEFVNIGRKKTRNARYCETIGLAKHYGSISRCACVRGSRRVSGLAFSDMGRSMSRMNLGPSRRRMLISPTSDAISRPFVCTGKTRILGISNSTRGRRHQTRRGAL